ncbi:MAG: exo-beta-N-acetylmuramidase NamZ domain-containing protein [Vicinamibacteria bacterium]
MLLPPDGLGVLAIVALLLGSSGTSGAGVEVGLERIDADGGGRLRGKRVGLLAHAASLTSDGRRAVDVLRSRGVRVVRLFTPEHGLDGRAPAGSPVTGGRDEGTGLPIVSLYGSQTRPSRSDLDGLDALVVDLQDAGVRFYTYAATMLLCLEAAAEVPIEVVILDRPNPLGGENVEGPAADLPEQDRSLLNRVPGPLVHGLTLGELARVAAAGRDVRLTVVPMTGWSRRMRWADTGRAWTPPSPNLRTAEAALVYPGVALLEATNVSEGRGTPTPFLWLGSPWLRPSEVLAKVKAPGLAFEPMTAMPTASDVAPQPKYDTMACSGIRIRVTDASLVRPYALGLSLLEALRSGPDFRWADDGRALDALLGTRRVRDALERGRGPAKILESDAAAIARFRVAVRPFLLY